MEFVVEAENMDSSEPIELDKKARIFSGGISRALLANRSFTPEDLKSIIVAMTKECLENLRAHGFEWSEPELMNVADEAQRFVDDLGDRGDLRLELCADLLGAIAVYHDAATNGADDRSSTARCVSAAFLIGSFDAMRGTVQAKVFDDASLRRVMRHRASQHAMANVHSRKQVATLWKTNALKVFHSRNNRHQTPETWAKANHKTYAVRPGTLAKALQRALKADAK